MLIGVTINFRAMTVKINTNYSVNRKACGHKKMPNIDRRLAYIN